jgi:hypothetical protein
MVKPLLISLTELGFLLGRHPAVLRKQLDRGLLPAPVEGGGVQGRRFRWRLSEIESWAEHGCPDRATWEGIRDVKRRR